MKAMRKNLTTLVICLVSTMAIAGMPPEVLVSKTDEKAFTLSMDNTGGEAVLVTLKDVDGNILQSDRIRKQEPFSRKYNLSDLPVGEYKLFVEDGARTSSHVIIVNENGIKVPKHLMAEYFAPAIVVNEDNLDFTMLCLRETLVAVEIRDEEGRINYSEGMCEQGSMQRRFDISDLEPGTYTITTSIEGQNFETRYYEEFTVGPDMAGY